MFTEKEQAIEFVKGAVDIVHAMNRVGSSVSKRYFLSMVNAKLEPNFILIDSGTTFILRSTKKKVKARKKKSK